GPGSPLRGRLEDLRGGVERNTYRWRHDTQGGGSHHDQTEVHRVNTELRHYRHENRGHQEGDHRRFDEHATHHQESDRDEDHQELVLGHANEEFGHALRHLVIDDPVTDRTGHRDQNHDDPDVASGALQCFQE